MSQSGPFPLLAVVGPTGSGKSDLALAVACELGGEIVNCDSVQVFRFFDIGTAKTPEEERRGIPHHLLDCLHPTEIFNAGDYAARARPILFEIVARKRIPIVVGGTGFYLRALIDGLIDGPGRDDALRARLAEREMRRPGALHKLLSRIDPRTAGSIHANDVKKAIRALEVCFLARRRLSDLYAEGRNRLEGFRPLKIGLNPKREALFQRLNERAQKMFEAGLVEEVRRVLEAGIPRTAKPFESVGYKQALDYLEGRLSLKEAVTQTQQATRQYAKRQWTWFHHDGEVLWYDGFGHEAPIRSEVLRRTREYVESFHGKL